MWSRSSSLVVSLAVVLGFFPEAQAAGSVRSNRKPATRAGRRNWSCKTAETIEFSTDEVTWT